MRYDTLGLEPNLDSELAMGAAVPDMGSALMAAEAGDPLELDLLASGFYGEEVGGLQREAEVETALRSLGDLLSMMRRQAIERRWGVDENTLLNMAFRHGHHFVEVDRARRAVVPVPAPRDAVRRKANKFEPWYRQQHSRLAAGMPAYHFRPKTRQQTDRDASSYAEELAEWRMPHLYSLDNRADAAMWKLLAGNAVIYVGVKWERDAEYMVDAESGEPLHRPDLEEEVFAPQACWCDDRISSIRRMRWFGVDRFTPLSEARALFPEQQDKLDPVIGPRERGHQVLRRVQRLTGRDDPWGTGHQAVEAGTVEEEEETVICEFWLRPGQVLSANFLHWLDEEQVPLEVVHDGADGRTPLVRFPEGLRVSFTPDGEVLEIGANLYGDLPFAGMRFSRSPGFWSYAPATPLREIQQAWNWVLSMRETHLLKVGNAPLMEPREARVHRRGSITSALASVRYRANRFGARPEYLNPPQMPADFNFLMDTLEGVWQDIGGIHEVSQAKLPSADLSGVTVSLLQEQDLQQLGYAGEEQEAAFVDLMMMELRWIQKFFPSNDPRLVALAGDAPYKLSAFMQANLADGLDIQCVKGSSIPRSPAAVEAKAKEAWAGGWMLDQYGRPDYRRMQEISGFGSADDLYQEEETDVANARIVEDQILALDPQTAMLVLVQSQQMGTLPPPLMPKPEDDPFVHEREHRLRLKRLQNEPRANPMCVELLRMRWQMIVANVAQLMLQQEPAVAMQALGPTAMGALGPGQPEGAPDGGAAPPEEAAPDAA